MKKIVFFLLALAMLAQSGASASVGAFVADEEKSIIPIPTTYEVYGTIKNLGDAGFMNHPEDLFIGPDDMLYVADTENNRVLKMDRDGNVSRIFSGADGLDFKRPRGVYVHADGSVWVADTGNLRLATVYRNGDSRKVYVKPDSKLLENNFTFDIQKVFVANTGYIYVLKGANLIAIDEGNNFHGYLGADGVGFSLSRFLIRMFGSKSQIERTVKQEPASYSNFFIASDHMIYGILSNKNTGQIRKLNTVGNNTYPEKKYGLMRMDKAGEPLEPSFADITVEDNGVITAVDRNTGLLYQYDQEGNLLACFGGLGDRDGLFQIPTSIDADSEGYLYVLDYSVGAITVFKPTRFIQVIHKAVTLHGQGRYDEAMEYWRQTLEIDANYALAHQGAAKIYIKQEQYASAMASYSLADNKEGYSEAFAGFRHALFREHFFEVVLAAFAVLFLSAKLLSRIKRLADRWADDVQMGRNL